MRLIKSSFSSSRHSGETSIFSKISRSTSVSTIPPSPSFPSEFGFYRSDSDSSTTLLALSSENLYPFAQSSTYKSSDDHPDITLYPSRNKPCGVLASTRFSTYGEAEITLGAHGRSDYVVMNCFSWFLEYTGRREEFEWRPYQWWELKTTGHSSGMKLVRVETGKDMALYAKVSCAKRKTGKMKLLPGEGYGNEFQIMAVMSLLAILEAEKRKRERAASYSSSNSDALMMTAVTCTMIGGCC